VAARGAGGRATRRPAGRDEPESKRGRTTMKKPTVQQKIAHAASGAAVLRTLVITDAKLTYQQFGEAIGLIIGKWEP
jgi:hypothetical protein